MTRQVRGNSGDLAGISGREGTPTSEVPGAFITPSADPQA